MKITTTFFLLSLFFLASLPCFGLNYTITFTGSGASTTVGDVIVQNLTQSTSVTVPAGNVLNLADQANAVEQLSATDETIHVYSNSVEGKSTVSFFAKQTGVTQINAFGIDGRKIAGITANLQAGMNSFQLSLPKGAYAIQVSGNGYTYSAKMINQSTSPSKPEIIYIGTLKPVSSNPQKTKSSALGTTTMTYATGDQLLYKGTSGNYRSIVTDIPTTSKTINFDFVACADADGNNYTVVTIGTQTWMAENLKTTTYNDGTSIPNVTDNKAWAALSTPAYCWYNNDATYKNTYGALYNWYAAVNTAQLAPTGWHVPTDAEWTTLTTYLGDENGAKLKETGTAHWLSPNVATNETGFSALPGGYCAGSFGDVGGNGYWWSATEHSVDPSYAWCRFLNCNMNPNLVSAGAVGKAVGFSVRCVRKSDDGAETCTLNVAATNGTVVKNPDQTAYEKGTNVMLTATPNSGSVFVSWSGGATGSTNPLSVTMDASKNITANFISLSNSTAGIQALIDQCPLNGTVSIPAGTYMIDALISLNLKSNMTLKMTSGTILKAIPNGSGTYGILRITNVTNVNVISGTVQGERHQHLTAGDYAPSTSAGEWGMGIWIAGSSNVTIDGVTATQCWGDGFYQGGFPSPSKNITIQNVVADDNRRQGLSIENVDGMLVQNSIFKNTKGTWPMAGIDIEPFLDDQNVTNITMIKNQIFGNQADGIMAVFYSGSATQRNITIEDNDIHDNHGESGIRLIAIKPGVIVKNNNIHNNQVTKGGIWLLANSTGAMITGNKVVNNTNYSVIITDGSTQNAITGNTFTGNGTNAILDNVGGNVISPNTVGP